MPIDPAILPTLEDPLAESAAPSAGAPQNAYDQALRDGAELIERPYRAGGLANIERQHAKDRMTIWERIGVLTPKPPAILYRNWGKNLDGASLVTAILEIEGRDVALYGHDFTVRAGSM